MARAMSINNLYDKKIDTFPFDGVWKDVMDCPEKNGLWIVYGPEKHGKTWFSLMLADYLSQFQNTLYVSAEEGLSLPFIKTCKRAKLKPSNQNLKFTEYETIEEIKVRLSKRKHPKIVILDNLTIYNDELNKGRLRQLLHRHKDILFVVVAHEEKGEPYMATAKLAKKLAKIIVRVQGLACFVGGRCSGGRLDIDETKSQLYHGMSKEEAEIAMK